MEAENIREIMDIEIDDCAEVIRESFLTVAEEFGLNTDNCPTNGAFIKSERLTAERQKGNLMYALFKDDRMVGFMALEDKTGGVYELEKLAILPQCRHCGYGKKLIDFAKEKVLKLDGIKITIGIIEENTKLKNWYANYGFKHTGIKIFPHLPFTVGFMELDVTHR